MNPVSAIIAICTLANLMYAANPAPEDTHVAFQYPVESVEVWSAK